jgi:hypothetical protein
LKVTDRCEFEQNWRYQGEPPTAAPVFLVLAAGLKENGPPMRAVSFSQVSLSLF